MSSRSLLAIALKFLLVFSLPSYAASVEPTDAADNLLKLHQLRLAAQKSLGDFYMYNGMEGDQRYARVRNARYKYAFSGRAGKVPSAH